LSGLFNADRKGAMNDHVRYGLDAAAAATAFSSLVGWLPSMASLLSIIWLLIQIYEWARKKKDGGK
jgi:hypothetical protein